MAIQSRSSGSFFSDGGGEFVQRLSACRDEREAERAAWLFNILHYVVRAWPWIIVALAFIVIFPELLEPGGDPELGYPLLMLRYLPAGLLGLVVASFLAAFMSTVSTQINWGASYVVNDLYARFIDPEAAPRKLVALGRVASAFIVALAGAAAFYADDVGKVFRFMIAIGTGPGAVLMLRWFWWRVNAWAELAAMFAGFAIALISYLPTWGDVSFGARLAITAGGSAMVWIPVMFLTAPEDEKTLEAFYRRVRPGGPGWSRFGARLDLQPVVLQKTIQHAPGEGAVGAAALERQIDRLAGFAHWAVQPPSTGKAVPVIDPAASEHRNTASAPSCSVVTNFLVG